MSCQMNLQFATLASKNFISQVNYYTVHIFFNNLVTTTFAIKMLKTPVIIDHKLTLESHESFVQTISVPNRSQLLYLRGYFYCNSLQGCLAHCGTLGLWFGILVLVIWMETCYLEINFMLVHKKGSSISTGLCEWSHVLVILQ